MKKLSFIFLIAVLALSAVFAADVVITATGDVEASYVVDFDKKTGTYNVPELDGELEWEVILPVAKAGSEYPYIDVAGEIEVDLTNVSFYLTPEVDFSTFEIVGEDWKVDFLASIGTLDFAVSAIDTAKYDPKSIYNVVTGRKVKSALTYIWEPVALNSNAVAVSKDGVGTLKFIGSIDEVELGDEVDRKYFKSYETAKQYAIENESALVTYKDAQGNIIVSVDTVDDLYYVVGKATTLAAAETSVFAVEGESAELKIGGSITTQFGFGFAKKDVEYTKSATDAFNTAKQTAIDQAETEEKTLVEQSWTDLWNRINTDSMNAGFSIKSSYEDIFTVAADFGYDFVNKHYNYASFGDDFLVDVNGDGEISPDDYYVYPSFSFDVASSFKYEMVSIDVYYANGPLFYYNSEDLYKLNNYQYYSSYGYNYRAFIKNGTDFLDAGSAYERFNLLSAKASLEIEGIGTTFTFTGKDLLVDRILSYQVVNTYFDNYTFTFDASAILNTSASVGFKTEADFTAEFGVTAYAGVTVNPMIEIGSYVPKVVFTTGISYARNGFSFSVDFCSDAYADAGYLLTDVDYSAYFRQVDPIDWDKVTVWDYAFADKKYAFTVKAGYEAEMFTLSSAVEFNTHETSAYKYTPWALCKGLYVTTGIESDKVVDGATLSLIYESAELLKLAEDAAQYGTLTAAVTVEF